MTITGGHGIINCLMSERSREKGDVILRESVKIQIAEGGPRFVIFLEDVFKVSHGLILDVIGLLYVNSFLLISLSKRFL